ncbi:MAG: ABC transporter ATP-binding protein [bacterium]|nr:ABC transporter ATP-binding protein [bacterium]MDE0438861.1 ABC transporter ATP-binding protein [bacterium]
MMIHRRIVGLTAGVRQLLALSIALGLAISATWVAQGVLIALVVRRILDGGGWTAIAGFVVAVAALTLLRAALLFAREVLAKQVAAAVKTKLRRRLFAQLLLLGPGYLEHTETGKVQATLVDGVEALESYVGYYLPHAVVSVVVPICIFGVIVYLDPLIGVVVLAFALAVPLIPRIWDRILGEYGARHWAAYSSLDAQFVDSMQGMVTLKALNASERRGEELRGASHALYRATMAQLSISMIRNGLVGFAMSAGVALAVGIGSFQVAARELGIAALLIVLFLSAECFRPLVELDVYWHAGYMGISASTGIFELLDAEPGVHDAAAERTGVATSLGGAIALHDVTYRYSSDARPALAGVSLEIREGETVAIVGHSGAGKTTVASLLLRFFDPQEGRLTFGETDLRDIPLDDLRHYFGYVSQDTYLFYGTIEDNLRIGRPDATPEEIRDAAGKANIHAFIQSLPNGYETIVGERGAKLSGGERQRIAIARALLKDAPVLILDEATSNLDSANEAAIRQALSLLTRGRTTIVIAHRLSSVVHADRIVVLDNGRVAESGRHGDLLSRDGHYAQLVRAQHEGAA